MKPRVIGLSDGANFYYSCELAFDPSLKDRPVIVLSNNDGCAIARSEAAKKLGIKTGSPFHLIRDIVERHGVRVFSSNYTLYADLSRRVVETYEEFSPIVEVYSIDESFLEFTGVRNYERHVRDMRKAVLRRTGIPVRVGLGPTKVLSKVSNEIAKKNEIFGGVLDIGRPSVADWLLPMMPVGDVCGIGPRTQHKLVALGVHTAADLRDMPLRQARSAGTVVLERIVLELQGEACIEMEEVEPRRKGMAVTRSAGSPMTNLDTVISALTAHATRAAEKLRQHGLVTGSLTAFFHTNRRRPDRPQHSGSRTAKLVPMSNDTLDLVRAATRCARAAWPKDQRGYGYTKAGVILDDLLSEEERPLTLFDRPRERSADLMKALDEVNDRHGKKTLVLASEGFRRSWALRSEHRSPRYTTRISDLPVVR